jgi:hypothetical protein
MMVQSQTQLFLPGRTRPAATSSADAMTTITEADAQRHAAADRTRAAAALAAYLKNHAPNIGVARLRGHR